MQRAAPRSHDLAKPRRPFIKDPERYKTVPCTNGWYTNSCPYGSKCQFAHCKEELRERAPVQTPVTSPRTLRASPPLSPKRWDGQELMMTHALPPPPPSPNGALSPTSVTYEHIVRVFSTPMTLCPITTPSMVEDDNETLDFLSSALANRCIHCEE